MSKQEKKALAFGCEIIPGIPNWKAVEQIITTPEVRSQHMTTGTKFEIAKYHLNRLSLLLPKKQFTDIVQISFDEKTHQVKIYAPKLESFRDCLVEYDSFLYSLRSCIDSFLLEVNSIYGLNISSKQVYSGRISKEMKIHYGKDNLTNHLITSFQSEWFKYFSDLRNKIAHNANSFLITSISYTSNDFKLYLPDDPNASKVTINKSIELFSKLNELLKNTENFLSIGYGYLSNHSQAP